MLEFDASQQRERPWVMPIAPQPLDLHTQVCWGLERPRKEIVRLLHSAVVRSEGEGTLGTPCQRVPVHVWICVCVCMCVCQKERERARARASEQAGETVKRVAEGGLGTGIIPESVDKKETILPKNHAIRWCTRKCLTQILNRQCPRILSKKLTIKFTI